MKTPDEIKKGLECCENPNGNPTICEECPYKDTKGSCIDRLYMEARKCIRQLEAKDVKQAQRIAELEAELDAVKRERDAAVRDMRKMAMSRFPCDVCSNDRQNDPVCKSHQGDCSVCSVHCPCDGCFDDWEMELTGNNFAWRGVCPENTEVQEDG